tara:strand:+ start:1299 stop:1553 length:255 start_codon:yes stop_codon:yes gene_type:complete
MKVLLVILSLVFIACEESPKSTAHEAKKDVVQTKAASTDSIDGLPADEEDCDDKFEKAQAEEKKVDENNLFGQNNEADEGCTLE